MHVSLAALRKKNILDSAGLAEEAVRVAPVPGQADHGPRARGDRVERRVRGGLAPWGEGAIVPGHAPAGGSSQGKYFFFGRKFGVRLYLMRCVCIQQHSCTRRAGKL